MKKSHSIHVAKTHLSRLVARACAGDEVVISRGKKPVAKLVPIQTQPPARCFGAMRGRARVTKAFFEPLLPQELQAWGE